MSPSNGNGGPAGPNNDGPGGPNNGGPGGPNYGGPISGGPNNGDGGPNDGGPAGPNNGGPADPNNGGPGGPNNGGPGGPDNGGPGGPNNQVQYSYMPEQERLNELADYVSSNYDPQQPKTLINIGIKFRAVSTRIDPNEELSSTARTIRGADESFFGNPNRAPGRTLISPQLADRIRNARNIHTCCRDLTTLSKDEIMTKNTRNTTNYSKTPVNSSTTQGGGKGSGLNTATKSNEAWL